MTNDMTPTVTNKDCVHQNVTRKVTHRLAISFPRLPALLKKKD